ncbi:hypothetical protein D9615_004956 [Tricholomella constricta]|uniref:Origin recognition complex subunit 2 n=1 Tax=Tricholomella constricta TaxID=117010 RepID=A0A8H5M773_9AGAR|nr:hypothetical protein D9615_004956 [Tricholomella constricta]
MQHLGDDDDNVSSNDEQEEDLLDEESDFEELVPRGKQKAVEEDDQHNLIVETAFDAYFTHASTRSRTSANVFSTLVPPLTAEEYNEGIESATKGKGPHLKPLHSRLLSASSRELLFSRFMSELGEGFNLLMYGYGSKRRVLNDFATDYCSKAGHVVVANAFHPEFTFKDLLSSIEQIPGILTQDLPGASTHETQSKRISDFFASSSSSKGRRHLYLIIHNIDAAPLRAPTSKSCLALLALTPRIHIVASLDHIHSPLLFSSSQSAARKPHPSPPPSPSPSSPPLGTTHPAPTSTPNSNPARGFAWLWHDLTTLLPYDFELAYADRTALAGAHGGGPRKKVDPTAAAAAAMQGAAMTETAALHILASVTQKAQKLFVLIATTQLEGIEEAAAAQEGGTGAHERDLQQFGIAHDILFTTARDSFIATNDTALRSLLGEFRDHGLVVAAPGTAGMGEVLWIPLRKERLTRVLDSLKVE